MQLLHWVFVRQTLSRATHSPCVSALTHFSLGVHVLDSWTHWSTCTYTISTYNHEWQTDNVHCAHMQDHRRHKTTMEHLAHSGLLHLLVSVHVYCMQSSRLHYLLVSRVVLQSCSAFVRRFVGGEERHILLCMIPSEIFLRKTRWCGGDSGSLLSVLMSLSALLSCIMVMTFIALLIVSC